MDVQETINGTTAADPSPAQSYPRDPIPTIGNTASTAATKQEDTKEKAQESGTEAKEETVTTETKAEEKTAEVKEPKAETEDELLNRIDKNPGLKARFDGLKSQIEKAESRASNFEAENKKLAQKIDELTRHLEGLSSTKKQAEPEITDEDLAEMLDIDPAQAIRMIRDQAKREAKAELSTELSEKETLDRSIKHLSAFKEQYPDFEEKFESGALSSYVSQNPIHNPISAYLLMTIDSMREQHKADLEKAISEAVAKARDEEKAEAKKQLEEAEKNFKAKREIKIVDDTPGITGSAKDSASDLKGARGHTLHERMVANLQRLRGAA